MNSLHLLGSCATIWHVYAAIIQNVTELLGREWNVKLEHTLHEGNSYVDLLAKMGASGSSFCSLFYTPPHSMEPLLTLVGFVL